MADVFDTYYPQLIEKLNEMAEYGAAANLLEWDGATDLPDGASDYRQRVTARFGPHLHALSTAPDYERVLRPLADYVREGRLHPVDPAHDVVAAAWKTFCHAKCLPDAHVAETSALYGGSYYVWKAAHEKRDWQAFLPTFREVIRLQRREAALLSEHWGSHEPGFTPPASPYDWLLDHYDAGMTSAKAGAMLDGLVPPLIALTDEIIAGQRPRFKLGWRMSVSDQEEFNRHIAAKIGFDFKRGRLAVTKHPFCLLVHPGDVRMATGFFPDDPLWGLYGTIHETGHGMYFQSMPPRWYGTSVGDQASHGLHESQSRMWENVIGKSREFCEWLAYEFRCAAYEAPCGRQLYEELNRVNRTHIRFEADEVTYNLHVALRFGIERDIMEGRLEAEHVDERWRADLKRLLQLDVAHDGHGPLQDVHWTTGFGYFPSYAFGNLWSAQIFAALERDVPDARKLISHGKFAPLHAWLHENLYCHGGRYTPEKIVRLASGEPPSEKAFLAYLRKKYLGDTPRKCVGG